MLNPILTEVLAADRGRRLLHAAETARLFRSRRPTHATATSRGPGAPMDPAPDEAADLIADLEALDSLLGRLETAGPRA